jgi:hypothetical protein
MGAYADINRNLMDVEFVHILRKMLLGRTRKSRK